MPTKEPTKCTTCGKNVRKYTVKITENYELMGEDYEQVSRQQLSFHGRHYIQGTEEVEA